MAASTLFKLLLLITTAQAKEDFVENNGSTTNTNLRGMSQPRSKDLNTPYNTGNQNAQKKVSSMTPNTEQVFTQHLHVPMASHMHNAPKRDSHQIKPTDDTGIFGMGIYEMNLLGVIAMDQDFADVVRPVLEASTEWKERLGQWFSDEPVSNKYSQYLVLLQDPIDHLVTSWYRHFEAYVHEPANNQDPRTDFYKCFPDLEEFAITGLAATEAPNDCQSLAQQITSGKFLQHFFGTFHYHHGYHLQEAIIEAQKPLYVIRHEAQYMLNDIERIQSFLLAQPNQPKLTGLPSYQKPYLQISQRAIANICSTLCQDIQVYKKVIQQSMNLGDFAYSQAQTSLASTCPEQAMLDTCPNALNDTGNNNTPRESTTSVFQSNGWTAKWVPSNVDVVPNDSIAADRKLNDPHEGGGKRGSYFMKYLEEESASDSF